MNRNIKASVILLVLDLIWIYLYMSKQYTRQIQVIQNSEMKVNPYLAILSYILMIVGLNMFVLPNIRKDHALEDSLKYGFTFGIILYGVYDFTAGAVLKDWNLHVSIIDILWGGFVYFISSYIASISMSKLNKSHIYI